VLHVSSPAYRSASYSAMSVRNEDAVLWHLTIYLTYSLDMNWLDMNCLEMNVRIESNDVIVSCSDEMWFHTADALRLLSRHDLTIQIAAIGPTVISMVALAQTRRGLRTEDAYCTCHTLYEADVLPPPGSSLTWFKRP